MKNSPGIELQSQIPQLFEAMTVDSNDDLKIAKYILQQLDDSVKSRFCEVLFKNAPENSVVVSWLCETDGALKYVDQAGKSAYLVENYCDKCPEQYFFYLLMAEKYDLCQQLLKRQYSEALDLLLQCITRDCQNGFKLLKSKYAEELRSMGNDKIKLLEEKFYAQQKVQPEAVDELD